MGLLEIQEWILQEVSGRWCKRSMKVYILPQCLTLSIDALKVPIVSPYLLGRSSCGRRPSLLRSSSWLRGSWRRRAGIGGGGGSAAISFVGRFGRVGEGNLVTWSKQVSVRGFGTMPEMRHVCVALAVSRIVGLLCLAWPR